MQDTGVKPTTAFVDLGCRGVDADNPEVRIVHRGKSRSLSPHERRQLRRRQAIEPVIGHLKSDHRMGRCHLKGETGDRLHALLCAAGYNIKWLLRMIARRGLAFLGSALPCLRRASSQGPLWLATLVQGTLGAARARPSPWTSPAIALRWPRTLAPNQPVA